MGICGSTEEHSSRDVDLGDHDAVVDQILEDATWIYGTISEIVQEGNAAGTIPDEEMGEAANSLFDAMCVTAAQSEGKEDFEASMKEMLAEPHDKGIVEEDVLEAYIEHASALFETLLSGAFEVDMDTFLTEFQECAKAAGSPEEFKQMFHDKME